VFHSITLRHTCAIVLAITVWLTLATQLLLCMIAAPISAANVAWAVLRFLTFFTVLANILVALTVTTFARGAAHNPPRFFARSNTATAIASYVIIVDLVYTLIILECPSLKIATLLALAIWCFARTYYFAFYVIAHYIDPTYRFAGLTSFAPYLLTRRPRNNSLTK
jgi:hypothetical protein